MGVYFLIGLGVVILVVLGLILVSRLAIVDFTEADVLDAVTDWKSFLEIKKHIEDKKGSQYISGLKLEQVLHKLECERKIYSRNFSLSREEELRLEMTAIPKYRIVAKEARIL